MPQTLKRRAKIPAPAPRFDVQVDVASADFRAPDIAEPLHQALRVYERGDYAAALKIFMALLDRLPDHPKLMTLAAICLANLGVRDMAVRLITRVCSLAEPDTDSLLVMHNLAVQLDMKEAAVRAARILVARDPRQPLYYFQLMVALNTLGHYSEAIHIGKSVIPDFPDYANLWDAVGVATKWRDGLEAALPFFEEAVRLAPDNPLPLNNMGMALARRDPKRAEALFRRALAITPDSNEPAMGLAFLLFSQGRLGEAHQYYKVRHHARRAMGQHTLWAHQLPEWDGRDLSGKTLLVDGEQGIGDEVMFAACLPALAHRVGRLYLSVEPRLVSIFERSFPRARVACHTDQVKQGYLIRYTPDFQLAMNAGDLKVDAAVPMGSATRFLWPTPADIPAEPGGWLVPDPVRVADIQERLAALGPGLKIGICWQSLVKQTGRLQHYFSLEDYRRLAAIEGIHFINMQYGNVADEIAAFEAAYGRPVHHFDDIDLKADIEANLAIAAAVDLVIGPGVSTLFFAASVGARVWWLTSERPWWCFGDDEHVPMTAHGRYYTGSQQAGGWDAPFDRVCTDLAALMAEVEAE